MAPRVLIGDAEEKLREIPDESIHCIVTSPPYWDLRDYGIKGQLGLEKNPHDYVKRLVAIMREARRVLRPEGTLWLNIGDSYASGKGSCVNPGGGQNSMGSARKLAGAHPLQRGNISDLKKAGLKRKDLVGIPWEIAFSLRADGWWLRRDIIWSKDNPMPESVEDRPITSHEYVFMFSKRENCFFDWYGARETPRSTRSDSKEKIGAQALEGRNLRSVWELSTVPSLVSHFAVFPPRIPFRVIQAATSARGCCGICGAPRVRTFERIPIEQDFRGFGNRKTIRKFKDWKASCACGPSEDTPCRVLDPFHGSGTSGAVAEWMGRDYIGIELNPESADQYQQRKAEVLKNLIGGDGGQGADLDERQIELLS